jgi:hypothetical protein
VKAALFHSCFILVFVSTLVHAAPQAMPKFHSAAAARVWGEQQEKLGNYQDASIAYDYEAAIRQQTGDSQGAEVERRRSRRLNTDVLLGYPSTETPIPSNLAKYEPQRGCYIGVRDDFEGKYWGQENANAEDFARRIDHPVAVALDYDEYGRPFPFNWAVREADRGRAVQIAWEPDHIADVKDDEYLNTYAEDAGRSQAPVFLRFGGEMNGDWTPWGKDPGAFVRAFRIVHDVMARHAPNVVMVWAPNAIPTDNLDEYYPGDAYVDWVGISLYMVRYYDDNLKHPAWQDNPAGYIEPFYKKYANRKPLCIVESGISRRSHAENRDADLFAADRVQDLLDAIKIRYPRVKMVCFFDRNNLNRAEEGNHQNDFSFPDGSRVLAALSREVSDQYFLGRAVGDPTAPYAYVPAPNGLPAGYQGDVVASIASYCLDPSFDVQRGANYMLVERPFKFIVPSGSGPLILHIHDDKGHRAKTVTVFAP